MSEDSCEEGKTLLNPASISKLSLAFTDLFKNFIKDFPEELIHDVLVRLPIKSIVKCTSVSNSWISMIKDPTFIRTHLTHKRSLNTQNDTHLLLVQSVFADDINKVFGRKMQFEKFKEDVYSLHYDNPACGEYCKIEFPVALMQITESQCFRVVGTCNGLVCLADDLERDSYNLVLWNPCVRKYVTLTEPFVKHCTHGPHNFSIGFGYDAVTNDYKVVRLTTLIVQKGKPWEYPTIAQVYSLAKGSWSRLRSDLSQCQMPGCMNQHFVNGAVHWLAFHQKDGDFSHFVLTFDVGSESFGEIMLPKKFLVDLSLTLQLSVSPDQKSIALFVSDTYSFLDIWLMKEYRVEKSWTKLMILTPQGPSRSLLSGMCFRKSGEVVLGRIDNYEIELFSMDLVSKQFRRLGVAGGQSCHVLPYEESLVLLDRIDAASY